MNWHWFAFVILSNELGLICELFRDAELKLLHAYQTTHLGDRARILAVGLSSRKNLCVNSRVLAAENRDSVDASCRRLTASWVRATAAANPNVPACEFFEEYEKAGSNAVLPPGVYTLQVEMNWDLFFWLRFVLSTYLGQNVSPFWPKGMKSDYAHWF